MAVMPPCPTLQNATSYASPPATGKGHVQGPTWQATLTDVQKHAPTHDPIPPVQPEESHPPAAQSNQAASATTASVDIKTKSPLLSEVSTEATSPRAATAPDKTDRKKTTDAIKPTLVAPLIVVPPPPVSQPKATEADNEIQTATEVTASNPHVTPATMATPVPTNHPTVAGPVVATSAVAGPTVATPAANPMVASPTVATPVVASSVAAGETGKQPSPSSTTLVTAKVTQPIAPQAQTLTTQSAPTTPAGASVSPHQLVVSSAPSDHQASPALPAPTTTAASTSQLLVNRSLQSSTATTAAPAKSLAVAKASPGIVTPFGATFSLNSTTSTTPLSASTAISATAGTEAASNNGAALAATVTALHQAGQTSTIMRLDPPGLGHLSVQIGMTPQGQVNVLFVPSSADAAHILQGSLPHFNQAMTHSGIALGQSQVGGQFAQSGGQNGQPGQQNSRGPERQNTPNMAITESPTATISGLSAYA